MTMSTDDKKARASALFKEEKQQKAVREKTERLRAQRLTRDAAAATEPAAAEAEAISPTEAQATNGDVPHVRLHRVKGRRAPKRR